MVTYREEQGGGDKVQRKISLTTIYFKVFDLKAYLCFTNHRNQTKQNNTLNKKATVP